MTGEARRTTAPPANIEAYTAVRWITAHRKIPAYAV